MSANLLDFLTQAKPAGLSRHRDGQVMEHPHKHSPADPLADGALPTDGLPPFAGMMGELQAWTDASRAATRIAAAPPDATAGGATVTPAVVDGVITAYALAQGACGERQVPVMREPSPSQAVRLGNSRQATRRDTEGEPITAAVRDAFGLQPIRCVHGERAAATSNSVGHFAGNAAWRGDAPKDMSSIVLGTGTRGTAAILSANARSTAQTVLGSGTRDAAPASAGAQTGHTAQATDPPPALAAPSLATDTAPALDRVGVSYLSKAAKWGAQLIDSLGERISLQKKAGIEHATIRLDPPELGSLIITIRRDAGALVVQMTASSEDVMRQLHAASEMMRHDLSSRQQGDIVVTVRHAQAGTAFGDQGFAHDRQARQDRDERPSRALTEFDPPGKSASRELDI